MAGLAFAMASALAGCAAIGGGGTPTGGGGPDPVIPSTPAGLTATPGNAQVTLAWTATSGATAYHVKRSTASGGPYTQIAAPASTSYSDTGLTNGTKYFYVVSALNSAGESANSSEVTATPVAPVTIPATPAGLAATAGNAQVSLAWTASNGATSYHVKRATVSGGPYTQIANPASPSYTDAGVVNGTKYFYVVSALNSAGESANSFEVNATPTVPVTIPAAPANLVASSGNAQVNLTWTASPGATSYHVKRSTASGGPYTQIAAPASTSYSDTGLTNGTKYYYVVSALNSAGESANSSEASATPAAPVMVPATPANLQATAGNMQVSLTWNASSGATSYNVKRATVNGGPYTQLAAPTAAAYTDTGLTNGTTYYYVVSAVNITGESGNSAQASATPAGVAPQVIVTINPAVTHPISPYIYGTNFSAGVTAGPPLLTFDRAGGDRWTAYNWETNASNAGSDYLYENDDYLSSSTVAAEAVRSFIAGDQASGLASLVTFQLQGLVAGDEAGPVSVANPPDLSRFKTVVDKKSTVSSAPFTMTPVTTDANVYMDEFAWALNQKFLGLNIFSGTTPTHPAFVDLDNEPELWNTTHLEVQGSTEVTPSAYISKTITLAEALKDQFPDMIIFGPVHYGFEGIYSWQGALNATPTGANWFPDLYLPAIKSASATYGKPIVDVYDFHWYAEDYDSNGTRIIDLSGATLTDAQVQLIVQSPRNLWDPTYTDAGNSNPWIYETLDNTPINILGRLQAKIDAENPRMKLAITEYESGGWNHIAGTIAQADNLGIFGMQGLFAANFWPPNGTYPYALGGFSAYRGFDGATACFGDTSIQATSSNVANVMVYASTDSTAPGRVVFVAINRSTSSQVTEITGQTLAGTAHLYQITAASAQTQVSGGGSVQPVAAGTMAVSGTSLTLTLPPLSVTTIDVH